MNIFIENKLLPHLGRALLLIALLFSTNLIATTAHAGPYQEGYSQGYNKGKNDGYTAGYKKHSRESYKKEFAAQFSFRSNSKKALDDFKKRQAGYKAGYTKGFLTFYPAGRKQGIADGKARARNEAADIRNQAKKLREKLRKDLEARCNSGNC